MGRLLPWAAVPAWLALLAAGAPRGTPPAAATGSLQVAQLPLAPPPDAGEPGSELTVYLLTMGPGDAVWERFGHNAIWLRDRLRGTDVAYNWGLFSFEQESFMLRFIQGRMLYWMAGLDAGTMLDEYVRANRSVWAQELELTPAQRHALREFVEWNALPENRFYRYDYYRDNCSTRVRDALDHALGGRIRAATFARPAGTTYRFHSLRLTGDDPLVHTGLDLFLGPRGDWPISEWEEMFLPMSVREHIRRVTVTDADGRELPLVRSERTLFEAQRLPEPAAPPSFLLLFLGTGLAVGGVMAVLAIAAARGRRGARWGLAAAGAAWGLVAGVVGTLLVFVWVATDHEAMHRNENLFHFTPLSLGLAVLVPLAVLRGRVRKPALRLALLVAGISGVGLVLEPFPFLQQANGALLALALPIHAALAWGLAWATASGGQATRPTGRPRHVRSGAS